MSCNARRFGPLNGYHIAVLILSIGFFASLSFAEGGSVSIEIPTQGFQQNGLNVSSVVALLESRDYSRSLSLQVSNSAIFGTVEDVPEGKYTLHLELLDGIVTIVKASATGYVRSGESRVVSARADFACERVTVIIDWDPTNSVAVEQFLNFSLNPDSLTLKVYNGLTNPDELADQHVSDGLRWFYRHRIWSNLDSNMVPIVQYAFGNHRNPVTTSHTALSFYDRYLDTNNPEDRQGFINNADWLLANHNEEYYFLYNFEWRHFSAPSLKKGWVSAMAQGQALGVVSIAYHSTGDEKYLEAARGVFSTLHKNGDTLWCIGVDEEDYYWLEEYPTANFCHVLNGKLFGLFGLWSYYAITRDGFALELFKAGLRSVIDRHSRWDVPKQDMSRYCWHNRTFSNYHMVHLTQLERYADFFDIPEFRQIARCFSNNLITSVAQMLEPQIIPNGFVLHPNHPNPFNASTIISFTLPKAAPTKVSIFNIRGQQIATLMDAPLDAGDHSLKWDASHYPSGLYLYSVENGHAVLTGRMTLTK
ncbi:T9SS type A sorting domain-containing protein [bacterium]|nr:T9SS type A sorting domain-containing protein [bacterium]